MVPPVKAADYTTGRRRSGRPACLARVLSRVAARAGFPVAPIDKLSLPLTIVLAAIWLGEPIGWKVVLGVALMTAGALMTIL